MIGQIFGFEDSPFSHFPSWSAQREELFPALLRYRGEETDVAVCGPGLALLFPEEIANVETSPPEEIVTQELIHSRW
jgi:hypothetical protein